MNYIYAFVLRYSSMSGFESDCPLIVYLNCLPPVRGVKNNIINFLGEFNNIFFIICFFECGDLASIIGDTTEVWDNYVVVNIYTEYI